MRRTEHLRGFDYSAAPLGRSIDLSDVRDKALAIHPILMAQVEPWLLN
ncbi:MAG TPA: hypothetical protein VF251_07920 [Pyrinomonadaceae bacterium]